MIKTQLVTKAKFHGRWESSLIPIPEVSGWESV